MSQQARWTASGIIEASVEHVWRELLETNPYLSAAHKQTIARENNSQHFTINYGEPATSKIYLDVDKQHHSIAAQGEWWYRGVHTVEPNERGSLLAYRVYNVAPASTRWAAELMNLRYTTRMRNELQHLLHEIGKRLTVKTTLQP